MPVAAVSFNYKRPGRGFEYSRAGVTVIADSKVPTRCKVDGPCDRAAGPRERPRSCSGHGQQETATTIDRGGRGSVLCWLINLIMSAVTAVRPPADEDQATAVIPG